MRVCRALLVTVLAGPLAAQTSHLEAQAQPPEPKPLHGDERRELLGSIDGILRFAAEDSGLAVHRSVRPRLVSRAEVTRYLKARFAEDESAKRLARSELVLKKFGLLPRTFDLKPFLLRLLTEQIAGFYDDKTKTVNLLNWVSAAEQKPVLAHELTHALQDQAVGLERWSSSGVNGLARSTAEQNEHVRRDEWETARSAVAEGQAMLVYTDYALQPTRHTLLDSPEVLDRLLTADAGAGGESSPVLAEAPRVLQEALLFPYTEGLAFEAALLRDGGKARAFAETLARPPASSYEVMTPAAYLAHEAMPVLLLPDLNALLGSAWTPYDVGVIGELDVRMLAESYASEDEARALAPLWAGGVYYAAQRKDARGEAANSTRSVGLVYLSRWKDAEAASRFAAMYRAGLARRYADVQAVPGDAGHERTGESSWTTGEGPVTLLIRDRSVLAVEGFSREETDRIAAAMLETPAGASASDGTGRAGGSASGHTLLSGLQGFASEAHYTLSNPVVKEGRAHVRVKRR